MKRRLLATLLILTLALTPAMAAERIMTMDLATGQQKAKIAFGTAGQILTSNGAGSVPTFQDAPVAMVYPGAGIPQSTGSAWGTSLTFSTDGTFADNSDANIPSQKAVKTYTDTKATKGANSDITSLSGLTTALSVDQGGTGQATAQAAIDALTNVSAATNEHVLTKDTATGNAIFKASAGGANTALSNLDAVAINTTIASDTDNTDDLGTSAKKWKDGYFAGNLTVGGTVDGRDVSAMGCDLIATLVANNSASLDFTSISNTTYDSYLLVGNNIVPATNAVDLVLRFSVSGNFQSGASDYSHEQFRFVPTGSGVSGSATDTGINISSASDNLANSGASVGGVFAIRIYNCAQTSTVKRCTWDFNYWGSDFVRVIGGGAYLTAANAIDGFRLLMSSGNITSGTVKLYGYRSS
jgi:hypothetical protein